MIDRVTASARETFICPKCRRKETRESVFRLLAGILAPSILWVLISQRLPWRTAVGGALVMIAFAVSAIFGTAAADSVMSVFYGIETKNHEKSDSEDNPDHDNG